MTAYTVHRKPNATPDDVTLVPEGFNTRAFLFTVLWALWNRLWVLACMIAVVLVAMAMLPAYFGLGPEITAIVQLALALVFGFEANDLRRIALARAGIEEIALVSGASLDEAELRYFAGLARAPTGFSYKSETVPSRDVHDPLGLFGNV